MALGNIQTNDLVVLMGRMSLNYCSCQKAPRIIRYVLRAESVSGDFSWRFDTKIDHPVRIQSERTRAPKQTPPSNAMQKFTRRCEKQAALIASQVDGRVDESRLTRKRGSRENKIHVRLQTHLLLLSLMPLVRMYAYYIFYKQCAELRVRPTPPSICSLFCVVCAHHEMCSGIILIIRSRILIYNWNASADTLLLCITDAHVFPSTNNEDKAS